MNGIEVERIRLIVMRMGEYMGYLCSKTKRSDSLGFEHAVTTIMAGVLNVAAAAGVDAIAACFVKMDLNSNKYRKDLCTEQIVKYTDFSAVTGIKKHNQTIPQAAGAPLAKPSLEEYSAVFDLVKKKSFAFVRDRNWQRLDTQDSLCLALLSEIGELADLVAWADCDSGINPEKFAIFRNKLGQELADVIIYLVRFSSNGGVELSSVVSLAEKHNIALTGHTA